MASLTTLEFNVNLTCGKCEKAVSKALSSAGMTDYSIDLPGQRVLVLTERTSDEVKETITSLTDGGCGPALACGVIARAATVGQNSKKICACDGVTIWDE